MGRALFFMVIKIDRFVLSILSKGLISIVIFGAFFWSRAGVQALTLDFASSSEWDGGTKANLDTTVREGEVRLESAGTLGARSWRTPDLPLSIGSTMTSDGTNLFVTHGLGDVLFWKYSTATDTWTTLAPLPKGAYFGADMEFAGGYIYTLFGGYQTSFARYSIANNSWELLANVPDLVHSGGSLTSDGTNIYVMRGNNTQDFYKYTVSSNSWTPLTGLPAAVSRGADLVRVGNYLYTPRGNNTTTFYRYDLTANTWSTLSNAPATFNEDFDISTNGTSIFVTRQTGTTSFYAYNIASNTWSTLTTLPGAARYAGAVYNSSDGVVYVFQGNGQYNFWKYDIASNAFAGPEDAPVTLTTGSDLVYHSGYMYTLRGSNTTTFYRYNLATGAWEARANAPQPFTDDTKGVVAGSYIYFFRGNNTSNFYRYDVVANTWSSMANAPALVRFGGALAYPGSGDYLYATRGATTRATWRYSISGDSWDDAAMVDLPTGAESSYGSRMASDGTDIYYLAGTGISRWFKYVIASDTWSELAGSPFAPYYGTDIAYHNGRIIAMAGYLKNDLWEYSISDNVWRKLQSLAGYSAQEQGPYAGASIEYDGSSTFYITRGNTRTNILTYNPGVTNYVSSGTWTSTTQDLGYVSSWGSFSSEITTPSDSSISFATQTSSDGNTWSGWSTVSGGTINSPVARYIQVRASLVASSGSSMTPVLKAISIDYTGDTTDPINPSTVVGTSQQVGGDILVDQGSYPHIAPYFTWSGATDADSSIAGYFVYFGNNNLADPETQGDYQSITNYVVTKALSTGPYYLRIQTKDSAGNISAATTLFTYVYAGVSPVQSLHISDSNELLGVADQVDIADGEIKLTSKSNGFWLQETLSTAPGGMQYGAKNFGYVESTNMLYALRGNNSPNFYSYNITSDTWTTLANAPGNVRMGGGVIEGPSGYLYGLRGNNTTAFWRYNIADNTWSDEEAAETPLTVFYGGSLVFDNNNYIYVLRGNNDDAFWRYNTSDDSWETLANTDFGATTNAVNNNVYVGGDLAIDQNDGLIYAIQGNLLDGFSQYNVNTNSWTVLPDLPHLPQYGASLEFVGSTKTLYYIPGYSSDKMYRYQVADQTWSEVAHAPGVFNMGAGLRNAGENLFALQGNNSTTLYKYNITKDSWMVPNRGLFSREFQGVSTLTESYGADILKGDGDNFYITRGNFGDDFVRWNQTTGGTTRLENTPVGLYNGSSLVYDSTNNKIYLTGGIYVQKFYVYDIASNTWTEESSDPPPANTDAGSSMVYDGSRYIYLNRGANSVNFYRFDTQGTSGNKWTSMANAPSGLHYGAELLLRGNYIYTLKGGNVANNPFYRYDIASNTWSDPAVADLNIDVYNDGFLVDGNNGNFYGARGENDTDFFSYSVDGNSWTQLDNTPVRVYMGGAGESNGNNKIHMLSGTSTGAYADAVYTYVMKTDTSAFEESGSYTTQTHDLTSVYQWATLELQYQAATNTTLTTKTRSSSDGVSWSSWTAVASEKIIGNSRSYQIKSPPARYIEIQFEMESSDGIGSGVIENYTINYYKDTADPSNPETDGLSSYSDDGGSTPIVSGNWYTHAAPFFDWPEPEFTFGASDTNTGSGVAGYYVYFGTDNAADPEISGVLQSDSSFTASSLVSGSIYYLRIKTVDNAGNIADTTWSPFVYKYDGEAPSAPTNVTADPSGFSATDSFDFSWDVASASGAEVTGYCYKTGATTGVFASDQCIATTNIDNIPSHKVGTNTFSVRTKDAAGNYSSYTTTSYFYVNSDNAPAPPTNLSVTPSSNTENAFAFSWDPPAVGTYFGSQSNLSYYYSINAVPTAQSTTATSLRSLLTGAYATLPGDNTFYVVTKDEAGNINYSNYASVTFTANTSAPGIPLNIDIADVSVKSTKSWKLAISWEAPANSPSVNSYEIFRSTDGVTFSSVGSSGGISFVDVGLTQQTYYYKVKACDNTNNCGAFSEIVSLLPDGKFVEAPALISDPVVSGITTKKATVSWATSRTSDSKIAYGTGEGDYFEEEVANSTQVASHVLQLSNLSPGTTYYYTAKWTDEDGNTGKSSEQNFTTLPPPKTEEPIAKSVGLDTALIEFTSKNATRVRIYYGETSAFGGTEDLATGADESTHTVQLDDLKDGTKYYFKINSYDSEGEEYEGEIHSFTTLPRPQISDIIINQVKGTAQSTLLLTWTSNTEISSVVTYFPIANPAAAKDEVNIALKGGKHQMVLSGLEPQSTYSIIIKGKDVAGNEAVGEVQQITTATDTRPPQITELKVEGEIQGSGEEATAQLVVAFKTDEAATAQIEFGEGSGTTYSQKTQEDSTMTNHHIVVISELTPGKVYHLKATSKDGFGNLAESVDKVVITPRATENALDLVISSMSSIFGFLAK